MELWTQIDNQISTAIRHPFRSQSHRSIGGGCINEAFHISDSERHFFVKLNQPNTLDMFEAEAGGLNEIRASHSILSPQVITFGSHTSHAFLVLEYITLSHGQADSAQRLGAQLAQMHRHTRSRFGWHRDNTIGTTPQHNNEDHDWINFWCERRLGWQLELAVRNGHGSQLRKSGDELLKKVGVFFEDYTPQPSLLHGDLWSGNYAFDNHGQPVIFDPAVYYGDREADIAMTELFGGFEPAFYQAYNEAYPLDSGYARRKTLYNLYHILNHVNLFGSGYINQAHSMIDTLLRQCS